MPINKKMATQKNRLFIQWNSIHRGKEPLLLHRTARINLTGITLHEKSLTQCIPFNKAQEQAQLINDDRDQKSGYYKASSLGMGILWDVEIFYVYLVGR